MVCLTKVPILHSRSTRTCPWKVDVLPPSAVSAAGITFLHLTELFKLLSAVLTLLYTSKYGQGVERALAEVRGSYPTCIPPCMTRGTNECWHKAVYILRISTCFLQGCNSYVSDGRDYVHLASCWYYDMDMCTWSSHGWVCYVTGHIPNCVTAEPLHIRPISTSFLKSLILQSFLLLVALTHVSKHFSPCSP